MGHVSGLFLAMVTQLEGKANKIAQFSHPFTIYSYLIYLLPSHTMTTPSSVRT